jgi:hypothetical protein
MSWLIGEWSLPLRLNEAVKQEWWRSFWHTPEAYRGGGVYRLIGLANAIDLAPALIRRVCGDDPEGTLYIGHSVKLGNRLDNLIKTHQPNLRRTNPHKPLLDRLADRFPAELLAVSWEQSNTPWGRERELITAYCAEFGERPPHNQQ